MLRTKNLQKYDFDDMDPWSELLGSVAWAICSTHHTTLQATPGQLVFGRDMLLNLKFKGPYPIVQVYSNGTVRVQNSAVTERINIRCCSPCKD